MWASTSFTRFLLRKFFLNNFTFFRSSVARATFRWLFNGNFAREITEAWRREVEMVFEFQAHTSRACRLTRQMCHMTRWRSEISSHVFFIHNILLFYSNSYQPEIFNFFRLEFPTETKRERLQAWWTDRVLWTCLFWISRQHIAQKFEPQRHIILIEIGRKKN